MAVEQLKQLIKDRLEKLGQPKIGPEETSDYLTLLGHVTLRLQETFGSSRIGEMEAPKKDDDQLKDCVRRLLAKKGNSLETIADRLLTMAASPNLKKDRILYWQYRAVIAEDLKTASDFDRVVKSV